MFKDLKEICSLSLVYVIKMLQWSILIALEGFHTGFWVYGLGFKLYGCFTSDACITIEGLNV